MANEDDAVGATLPADGAMVAAAKADEVRVGARIGNRYKVTGLLGQGGMGAVYLATDEVLAKEVALKFVHRDRAGGSGGAEKLRDEVTLAQQVTHENVCRTYDLEEADGAFLVKMEYVAGETLWRRISRGALPVEEALGVAQKVATGLEAAHAKGVVHCDLKPQNIMIEDGSGRVVLMDFGIARGTSKGSESQENSSSGTPEYMAPEQVQSKPVDGRADLYALGCVLYHMLTGETPFPATTRLASMLRHVTDPAPDPRAKRPDVPGWVAHALLRLLEKAPEKRYPDAAAVREALSGPRKRDWRRIGLLAAGAAALCAVGMGAVYQFAVRKQWQPLVRERLPAYEENADSPVVSPDGKLLAYTSDRDGTWRIYVEPMAGAKEGDGPSRPVTPSGRNAVRPRWAHDGKSILYASGPRAWRVAVGPPAGEPALLAEGAQWAEDCAGRLVLAFGDAPGCPSCPRLVVREPDGAERELTRLKSGQHLDGLRCDRAGAQVAWSVATGDLVQNVPGDVAIVPISGGTPRALTDDHLENASPTFSNDGKTLIFSSRRAGHTNLWEVAVAGGAPVRITLGEGPDLASDVTPDGKTVVFDNDVTSIPLYAIALDGGARRMVSRRQADVSRPNPTPDGREVVAAAAVRGQSRVVAYPVGDGDERVLADGELPALTPDGREVLFTVEGQGRTRVMAIPLAGGAARELAALDGRVRTLAAGGDGLVHLERLLPSGVQAWRLPLAGGAGAEEAPAPWAMVWVAPAGGYRVATRLKPGAEVEARVLAPGMALDDPAARAIPVVRRLAWEPGGQALLYWTGTEVRRLAVATGEEKRLFATGDVNGLAISADGATLYLAQTLGHVRRQLLTNFADRTRPAAP